MEEGKKHKGRFFAEVYVFVSLILVSFLILYFSNSGFILNFKDLGLSLFSGIRGRDGNIFAGDGGKLWLHVAGEGRAGEHGAVFGQVFQSRK